MSLESVSRSSHRRDRRTLQERLSTRDVTKQISAALADVPAKELAEASGSSLRAAENAKQGIHAMSLAYFFNAAASNPELNALAMEWLGKGKINPKMLRGALMILNAQGVGE